MEIDVEGVGEVVGVEEVDIRADREFVWDDVKEDGVIDVKEEVKEDVW